VLSLVHGEDGALNNVTTLLRLALGDDEGRGKADDVAVGGLGQQAVVSQLQAHVPGIVL